MFSCLFSLICVVFTCLWFILSFFLTVCLSVTVKWLAVKTASEMTYTVSDGALTLLNPIQSYCVFVVQLQRLAGRISDRLWYGQVKSYAEQLRYRLLKGRHYATHRCVSTKYVIIYSYRQRHSKYCCRFLLAADRTARYCKSCPHLCNMIGYCHHNVDCVNVVQFSNEGKILIKSLYESKCYNARQFITL